MDPAVPVVDDNGAWRYIFAAWAIALVATLGALFVGEVMGQVPCNLCWYQRIFMFPLAIILGVACLRSDASVWLYVFPVAAIGWLVAVYHSLLYAGLIPEGIVPCEEGRSCLGPNMTIFGGLPLPYLSLAAFSGIAVALALAKRRLPT